MGGNSICDMNCLNCRYDDCINDQMEYGDYAELNEIEKENREYKTPKKQREYFKKYYAEKREHRLEVGRRYYETHGEKMREYSRRYSKENKERKAAYLREWRRKRKEMAE